MKLYTHIIYYMSKFIFRQLQKLGVSVTFVSTSNPENISNAVKINTKLVWLEVCSNPSLQIINMKSIVDG